MNKLEEPTAAGMSIPAEAFEKCDPQCAGASRSNSRSGPSRPYK